MALGPAYRRLWTSTALTNIGDGIRQAAFPLLVASLTNRPELIAGVVVAAQLPWLLLGLAAGAVVDRVDRRRLLAAVDTGRAALLGTLVLAVATGHASVWLLYVVAFVGGMGETLRDTAAATMVPALLPVERWERANGLLVTAEVTGNELVGPALGGWLFVVAAVLPFAVNGGALAVAVLLVLSLPDVLRPVRGGDAAPSEGLVAQVVDGLRWLAHHRLLWMVTALAVLLALLDSAWFAILVLYARQAAGVTDAGFGALLSVGALGGIVGGLLASRIIPRLTPTATLSISVVLTGLAQLFLGLTSALAVIVASLVLSGLAFAVANVTVVGLRQRATPAPLLGRVTATYRTLTMAAAAAGALLGGVAATAYGVRAPMLIGAPVLIVAGVSALPLLHFSARHVAD
jgi:MFS family permease